MMPATKIAISAGELSGDQHAARVVQSLKFILPSVECRGMGGSNLRAQGVDTIVDSEQFGGVMGFIDVFMKLGAIRRSLLMMKEFLRAWKPSVLVVVDYPDFNLRLAAFARSLGIQVVYLIPPKVWAWRSHRAKQIGAVSNVIACIFPFERKFYEDRGIPQARYIGHPFASDGMIQAPPLFTREEFCRRYSIDMNSQIALLMPGSRRGEIRQHLATMIQGVERARRSRPTLNAVLCVAPTLRSSGLFSEYENVPWLRIVEDSSIEVMKIADFGVLKSGTCNLEAAFIGLPFVCVYKAAPIASLIAKRLVTVKEVSLPNIICTGTVRELLLDAYTSDNVEREIIELMNPQSQDLLKIALKKVKEQLLGADSDPRMEGATDAPGRAALLVASMMKGERGE